MPLPGQRQRRESGSLLRGMGDGCSLRATEQSLEKEGSDTEEGYPPKGGRWHWGRGELLEGTSDNTGRWRPPQGGVRWSWGDDRRPPMEVVRPGGSLESMRKRPRIGDMEGRTSHMVENFRERQPNETERPTHTKQRTSRDTARVANFPVNMSTSEKFQEILLRSCQNSEPKSRCHRRRFDSNTQEDIRTALDDQIEGSDDNRTPSGAESIGTVTPDMCAGTVALCSLYYIRLQKERQLRDQERRRRFFLFRRTKTRERLRFAVLWTSRLLSRREISTASVPREEWEGQERRVWSKVRSSALWNTVIEKTFSNFDWKESFRMTKSTFDYLCVQLRPVIQRMDTNMRRAIPTEVRLAMTLWRLGSSCEYRMIEKIFGVSRSTICQIVRDVCEAVVSILTPKYISVPQGDSLQEILNGFEERCGLPQLAGLIGTFHVAIRAPNEYTGQYYNTKGWHSVVLQAVVDSDYCFWDLNIGCPGHLSNSQVLLTSELYEWGTEGTLFPVTTRRMVGVDIPIHLLGPRSYPLLPWLMTPFADGSCPEYSEVNKRFSSALNGTRVAFGRLKSRWRCLLKRNDTDISFLPTLIAACCTLHNICEGRRDPFEDHWLQEAAEEALEQPSELEEDELEADGMSQEIRNALANIFRARNGGY